MNYKALINAILIVILLHLLIKNIHFRKIFSWNSNEQFNNHLSTSISKNLSSNCLPSRNNDYQDSLDFLLNQEQPQDCYTDLVDYAKECKTEGHVKPGNYYVEDENSPNFMSNVLNTHKFYDRGIDNNYDGLEPDELVSRKQISTNVVEEQECYPPRNLQNNKDLVNTYPKPDNWNYKNELPMNGGFVVDNVVGYDTLNEGFSMFSENVSIINPGCNSDMYFDDTCETKPDDIRFGLGHHNAEKRSRT